MVNNEELRDIDEITFGVYSAEEIKKFAVCKVDNPKLCNNDKNGSYGTVYDPRMGTIENGKLCGTCGLGVWECSGHFGYIGLNEPIVHPLYYKQVVNFLRCFCTKCYKLLITEEQIVLNNLNRSKGVKRFNKILERLEKVDMCTQCSHPQPAIKHVTSDNTISMVYKDKDKKKVSIILQVDEIKKIFDNISIKDVELLGFNPGLLHPSNLVLTVFPVIPTCFVADTYVLTDNGYKYIQDVDERDMLYTHKGNFKKINDFQVKEYRGELINIKTAYHAHTIKCTPEHPFYVKEVDNDGIRITNVGEPEWVNASELTSRHFIGMKRNTYKIRLEEKLNNIDVWFLIGYFVNNGYNVPCLDDTFFLYIEETNKRLLGNILKRLNIPYKQTNGTGYECVDYKLTNIIKEFKETIPNWVLDIPNEYILAFLEGYNNSMTLYFNTASNETCALIIQLLYLKIGKVVKLSLCKGCKDTERFYEIHDEEYSKDLNYLIEDEYIWYKVSKETTIVENIKVYNFEVDEDNSYCVENLISHNCCRPYVISDSNMCDDDLTIQLVEIIKANNHLEQVDGIPISDTKKQKYLQSLKFRISTFYNNSSGKAKHSTNGRSIKGIKERLTGKEGLIRTNLMGNL